MSVEIKVPSLGESETEATLVSWLKQEGDAVNVDDVLAEIESDKITMEITALDAGVLKEVRKQAGETVTPGEVIGIVDESGRPRSRLKMKPKQEAKAEEELPSVQSVQPRAKRKPKPSRSGAKASPVKDLAAKEAPLTVAAAERIEERVPLSGLRKRIGKRLKDAQNTAAILTTFNEVNMQSVMRLRARYREAFKLKHGVDLGLMPFFVNASVEALKRFPALNASIDGDDAVYHNYFDIGVAVATDKGLVVPALRSVEHMSLADIERGIADYASRAQTGRLMPDDLKGGTFSITNGGVFGSLLSTPILNPPQSAILGMHTIQKRPVVEDDAIVIRPMMYLALSYDHRLIDGKDAVQFLRAVKDFLEYPGSMLIDVA